MALALGVGIGTLVLLVALVVHVVRLSPDG
jgi:hypothetical protein